LRGVRPSDTKAALRARIEADTRAYLDRGGRITKLPVYATGVQVEISKRLRKSLGERVIWGRVDAE